MTRKENCNWGSRNERIHQHHLEHPELFAKGKEKRIGMKYRNWKRTFRGKTPEEIETIIDGADITAQLRYNLREKYLRKKVQGVLTSD